MEFTDEDLPTTPTISEVQSVLDGKEPVRNGYGSQFFYEQQPDCVQVVFVADWRPKYQDLVFAVFEISEEQISFVRRGKTEVETTDIPTFTEKICGDAPINDPKQPRW